MIKSGKKRISVVIDEPEKFEFVKAHLVGLAFRDTMAINLIIGIVYDDMKKNPSNYK